MSGKCVCVLFRRTLGVVLAVFLGLAACWAQPAEHGQATGSGSSATDPVRELQAQVRELQSALAEMRAETRELRRELEAARAQFFARGNGPQETPAREIVAGSPAAAADRSAAAGLPQEPNDGGRLAKLEEEYQLLTGKVDEHYQTKVESASKYRVRLSGIVLFNLFGNRGSVDRQEFPTLAIAPQPTESLESVGATLSQSLLGLEVFGPQLGGARASASLQMDFSGGFPGGSGNTLGHVRLRTATLRLDWPRTSVIAGQDTLFFSPQSPTSLASLAVPALSFAGNLWAWVPQVRVEHLFALPDDSRLTLQGGILDPFANQYTGLDYFPAPQGVQLARRPGVGARVGWSRGPSERRFGLWMGGYYARQNWGLDHKVDSWVGTTDWSLPFGRWFSLTGEFYRGRAVGELGGAFGRSIVTQGRGVTSVRGINSMGGWAQLKFEPASTLEFNAAFGQDNPRARDLGRYAARQGNNSTAAARNRASFANFIYRPRSNLVFSGEYRRLRTFEIGGASRTADHLNATLGVLF